MLHNTVHESGFLADKYLLSKNMVKALNDSDILIHTNNFIHKGLDENSTKQPLRLLCTWHNMISFLKIHRERATNCYEIVLNI